MGLRKIVAGWTRAMVRPFGYLAFAAAVALLSVAGWFLGESDELGFFAGRLSRTISRYPEVTRRGVWIAWGVWLVLLVLAVSPISPTHWDEVVLGAIGLAVLWRRHVAGRRVEH